MWLIKNFKFSAFLLAIVTIVFANFVVSKWLPLASQFYVENSRDLQGYQSQQFSEDRVTLNPAVFFFGGSGMKWSLLTDKEMGSVFDNKFAVYNFAHAFQSLIESYVYITNAKIRYGDIVILHASISRVNRVNVEDKLFCRPFFYSVTPAMIAEAYHALGLAGDVPNPLCNMPLVSRMDILSRIVKNALSDNPHQYVTHLPQDFEDDALRLKNLEERIIFVQKFTKRDEFSDRWLRVNDDSLRVSVSIVKKISDFLKMRGARLIVVDTPLNRVWFNEHLSWTEEDESDYMVFGKELQKSNIEYHDLRWTDRLSEQDFYDHQHVLQSGREKMAPIYKALVMGE